MFGLFGSLNAGKDLISPHDWVYDGVTPGVVPTDPNHPVRPANEAERRAVVAVRFEPPQGVAPEQAHLLETGYTSNKDVAAAFVALAVDGVLHLQPVERKTFFGRTERDWFITIRRMPSVAEIGPFRAALMVALSSLGRPATLTELKPALSSSVSSMLTDLRWGAREWYPNVGKLISKTGYRERTALGTALRYQSAGFRMFLETADGDRLRFEDGAGLFSRHLPWAIGYDIAEQWIRTFQQALDQVDPSVSTVWAADLAWYGDFGSLGDLSFDGFGDAMSDLGDALTDFADSIGDFASDVGDAGGGGDGGGDGGGGGD